MEVQEVIDPQVFDVFADVALTATLPDGRQAVYGIQVRAAEVDDDRDVGSEGFGKAYLPVHISAYLIAVNEPAAEALAEIGIRGIEKLARLR